MRKRTGSISSQVGPAVTRIVCAGEIVAQTEHVANFLGDGFGGGEASCARHAAGEIAFVGIDDMNAARAQRREIFLRGGVLPHVDVHGGRDDDGSLRGEIERGEKIVGDAVREFPEDVGGGGRDEKKIDALRDGDVFDGAFDVGEARSSAPNISVITFCPVSAAKVRGVMNSCAARVITTCTSSFSCCRRRTSSAAL